MIPQDVKNNTDYIFYPSVVGEHCEEHVTFFKQVFGDQALMKPTTFWHSKIVSE